MQGCAGMVLRFKLLLMR